MKATQQEQAMIGVQRMIADTNASSPSITMGAVTSPSRSTSLPDDGQPSAVASIDARSAESAGAHPARPYSVERAEEGCAFLRMVAAANPTFSRHVALAREGAAS